MSIPMHYAVHEAAHSVVAVAMGGFAEGITLEPGQDGKAHCRISWPDVDQSVLRRGKMLMLAAGPAATAIYSRRSLTEALVTSGLSDLSQIRELGEPNEELFREARRICRHYWAEIMAVARAAAHAVHIGEEEILAAMRLAREVQS